MLLKNQGFTLIELMITVGIVGVLAAIAIPAYQDYVIRARVVEGLSVAALAKVNVSDVHSTGTYGVEGYRIGIGTFVATKNVLDMSVSESSGIITLTMQPAAVGGTLTLAPFVGSTGLPDATAPFAPLNGAIQWRCAADQAQGLAPGQTAGTLLSKYAPSECR